MMKSKIKYFFLAYAAIYLSGCAQPADSLNMCYMPETSEKAQKKSKLYKSISIKSIIGGNETHPLWMSDVSAIDLKKAIEASLSEANYLAENDGKYNFVINLKKMEKPLFGFNTTVTSTISYNLSDGHKTILDKDIKSEFTATVGDSFSAVHRLKLANEGSIKENIKMLLQELKALK